jgi:RHS repeat-associated protein
MKNLITSLLFLVGTLGMAQTANTNYVKTTTYKVATNDGTVTSPAGIIINPDDKMEGIQYFDGLGRPIQSIQVKAGGNKENIIQHMEYDQYGRQVKNFLPYATNGPVTVDPLNVVVDPVQGINTYYQTNYGADFSPGILNPYSETEFENSPLNRPFKQAAPGADWAMSRGHEVKMDYQTNSTSDGVRIFGVNFNNYSTASPTNDLGKYEPTLVYEGLYGIGQLYKNIVKDENWAPSSVNDHTVEEFTDKSGKVILKRTYNDNQRHDTYYVYDDYGNLSYVIPPLASDQIVVQNRIRSITGIVNTPWTRLTNIDREFAANYDSLLAEFDNAAILNAFITNEYNGIGGLSIQNHNNGEYLSVSINFSVNQPLQLKTGYIQSLKSLGNFEDTDIGVIEGNGYVYNLSVKKNELYISGSGELSSLQTTVSNQTSRDYNINYPWVEFVEVGTKVRSNYINALKGVDNAQILNTSITNIYNGTGGLNVSVDSNDNVSVAMSASWNGLLPLRTGAVITLNVDRSLEDRLLGNITTGGSNYTIELKNNTIVIIGEGDFTGISDNFVVGPFIRIATIDQSTLEGLCYIYEYDHRNRLAEKKIPGKDWEHIIYDGLDRPILTQDGNQRLIGKWSFTKYDKLGRVVYTGIYDSSLSRKQVQEEYELFRSQSNTSLTISERLYEVRIPETSWASRGKDMYYTHRSFPNINIKLDVLTISFYDDKVTGLVEGTDFKYDLFNKNTNDLTYTQAQTYSLTPVYNDVKAHIGLATISEIRVLGTNNWINSAGYYDQKARSVFSISTNEYLSTVDKNWMDIDFVGKVLGTESLHQRTNPNESITVEENFSYDHMDRLVSHSQSINGQQDETIVENSYDKMGQLISKGVGGRSNAMSRLQDVNYDYNIRGWLTDINKDGLAQNDLFSFSLKYNDPTQGVALYNGNISQTQWVTASDAVERNYNYNYDALNRIIDANYFGGNLTRDGAPGLDGITENYSMGDVVYDKNGNITKLSRYGLYKNDFNNSQYTAVDKVDALVYTYAPKSNQLMDVKDLADNVEENILNGGFHDTYNERNKYEYLDLNGNMTMDRNKGIDLITYNHLNLPKEVFFNNDSYIEYTYDAVGTKLKKFVKLSNLSSGKTTYYAGNYIYEQQSSRSPVELKFFSHSEGYIERNGSNFDYVYQYKDHLGNIRLSYSDGDGDGIVDVTRNNIDIDGDGDLSNEIKEENNYYPFGLQHKGYNNIVQNSNSAASKFKYNGKELNDELGLDWYHYGARFYDPATARWFTPDAMAEKYYDQSLYNYTVNNPILFIDPDGNQVQMCCEGLMDAVAGFVVGTATNLVPGSTNWRNSYTPNNADTYNNALRVTDIVETTIAIPLIADGLKNVTIGGTTTVVGAGASATGVGAVAGVPTIVVGGTITATGAVEIAAGAMFMINGPNNMAAGYDYGRTDNSTPSKKVNPKKAAREKAKAKRDQQPASEDYAKYKAKEIEKTGGKEARRAAHDKKEVKRVNGRRQDRTKKEIDRDYKTTGS